MNSRKKKYQAKEKKLRLINQPGIIYFLILLFFSAMAGRLFWLQILKGSYYRKLSDENRIRLIAIPPIRGRLLDRNGQILVDNRRLYSLVILPRLITLNKWPDLRYRLSNLLNISIDSLDIAYNKGLQEKSFSKALIKPIFCFSYRVQKV